MILICCQGKTFNITVIQLYAPTTNIKEVEVDLFYEDLQDFLKQTPKKKKEKEKSRKIIFITGDWNEKIGSQEIIGGIGNFALEYKMKQDRS